MDQSISEALIATNELATRKGYEDIFDPNPLQKFLMVIRWLLSDHNEVYADNKVLAELFKINEKTLKNYLTGVRAYTEMLSEFEAGFNKMRRLVSQSESNLLSGIFRDARDFVSSREGNIMSTTTSSAHHSLEDITNKRMTEVNVLSIHEYKLPNGKKPDNLFFRLQEGETEKNSNFIKEIEDKQSIIAKEKLRGYKQIAMDHTISPKETWIRQKCEERGYATKDRLLIIVLYGYHSKTTIDRVREIVDEYEHVELLTIGEYKGFLGLKGDLLLDFNELDQATIDVFNREDKEISDMALKVLRNIKRRALLSLRDHKEKYLAQVKRYFLGKIS